MANVIEYFNLTERPFELTPDLHFYCQYETHQNALNTLLFCISEGEGFVKITGEVGSGKSILCRKLVDELEEHGDVTLYLPNPSLSTNALLHFIMDELDLKVRDDATDYELNKLINKTLIQYFHENKKVVLLIDEAQTMQDEGLEALRLLSNLEAENQKLLQIVLFGQPELDIKLSSRHLRQLNQRIRFSYDMTPLQRSELDGYLEKRLLAAGHQTGQLFTKSASSLIYQNSKGIPRVVNILSYKALLAAYASGKMQVDVGSVKKAILDSQAVVDTVYQKAKQDINIKYLVVFLMIAALVAMFTI